MQLYSSAFFKRKNNFFDKLPQEIKFLILTFLEPKDLCRIASVCKNWKEITADDHLWKRFNVSETNELKISFKYLYMQKLIIERAKELTKDNNKEGQYTHTSDSDDGNCTCNTFGLNLLDLLYPHYNIFLFNEDEEYNFRHPNKKPRKS